MTELADAPTGEPEVITHRVLNRELSWLDFNERVLELAGEPGIPLLERAKFCAIFATNLDEFFQVRVAALRDQVAAGIDDRTWDGRTPHQQLVEVSARVPVLLTRQEDIYVDDLMPALAADGIEIVAWDRLADV